MSRTKNEMTHVLTAGVFDVLHPGHQDVVSFCRSLGNFVTVVLWPDDMVTRLKGPTRPHNGQEYRLAAASALLGADETRIAASYRTREVGILDLIRTHKPDYFVVSPERQFTDGQLLDTTQIVIDPGYQNKIHSTTELVRMGLTDSELVQ